jgi:DDE family transposase
LHLGVDADTGEIVAAELTSNDIDDGSQVGPLLDQGTRPVASFIGDGAFDRDDAYGEVAERHPDAAVIVPPRSSAGSARRPRPRRRSATDICSSLLSAAEWAG